VALVTSGASRHHHDGACRAAAAAPPVTALSCADFVRLQRARRVWVRAFVDADPQALHELTTEPARHQPETTSDQNQHERADRRLTGIAATHEPTDREQHHDSDASPPWSGTYPLSANCSKAWRARSRARASWLRSTAIGSGSLTVSFVSRTRQRASAVSGGQQPWRADVCRRPGGSTSPRVCANERRTRARRVRCASRVIVHRRILPRPSSRERCVGDDITLGA